MAFSILLLCLSLLPAKGSILRHRTALPINIINLQRDTERWSNVIQGLLSKGVPKKSITRYAAVYGKELTKADLLQNSTLLTRLFCTSGTIGCYLSHRNLWCKIHKESAPWQIIMEDDVIVANDFCDKVREVIREMEDNSEMKDNWDVILLGAFGAIKPDGRYGVFRLPSFAAGRRRKRRKVSLHCHVPERPFGMHAYILSRRGAEKLVRAASIANGHVDVTAWGLHSLVLVCRDPLIAYQDMDSPSTIGAVTRGLETKIPRSIKVDEYTNIALEWALNEPLILIPGFNVLITIGRSLAWAWGGMLLAVCLSLTNTAQWVLPIHLAAVALVFWLLRVLHEPAGMSTDLIL